MRAFPLRPDLQAATSSSYDADGFLVVGVDGDADGSTLPPAEAHFPLGFIARPLDPGTDGNGNVNAAQACNLLRLTGDNVDDAMPFGDPRITGSLPQLPVGAAMLYEPSFGQGGSLGAVGDLARLVLNGDGSHGILIHVAAGGPKVTIEVAGGPSVTVDSTAVQLGAPGGQFVVVNPAALSASFAALQAALAGAGVSWTPPTGIAATKTKAT